MCAQLASVRAQESLAFTSVPMNWTTARITIAALFTATLASWWLRGGESLPSAEHVAHVSIDAKPACLGTLIAPGWVLTAKHCVQELTANEPIASERIRVSLRGQAASAAEPVIRNRSRRTTCGILEGTIGRS